MVDCVELDLSQYAKGCRGKRRSRSMPGDVDVTHVRYDDMVRPEVGSLGARAFDDGSVCRRAQRQRERKRWVPVINQSIKLYPPDGTGTIFARYDRGSARDDTNTWRVGR